MRGGEEASLATYASISMDGMHGMRLPLIAIDDLFSFVQLRSPGPSAAAPACMRVECFNTTIASTLSVEPKPKNTRVRYI